MYGGNTEEEVSEKVFRKRCSSELDAEKETGD